MEIRFLEEAATWQEHFVQAMKGIWDEGELFGQLGNLFDILQDRVKQEATSTTGALTEEGQNCLKKLRQVFCQISRIYQRQRLAGGMQRLAYIKNERTILEANRGIGRSSYPVRI